METTVAEDLLRDYLHRLDQAATGLPAGARADLVEGVADHIDSARAAGEAGDEVAVRRLLDRLGDPDDIVAAAREDSGGDGGASVGMAPSTIAQAVASQSLKPRGIALEVAAVLLMTVGSIIPFVGWLAGVVLLWTSSRWRTAEKVLATMVVPFGPLTWLAVMGLLATGGSSCSSSSSQAGRATAGTSQTCTSAGVPTWIGIPLALLVVVVPFVIGGVLLHRASARARLEVG